MWPNIGMAYILMACVVMANGMPLVLTARYTCLDSSKCPTKKRKSRPCARARVHTRACAHTVPPADSQV